jgi:hypothetical protein
MTTQDSCQLLAEGRVNKKKKKKERDTQTDEYTVREIVNNNINL